ncbi:glycosyltransferase family 4 protein [Priestia megaterium]|uniref:glycosyltransferase family 4 protein n=1 Tax=Priestia megaterium TaxID=1404 RepID=UPI00203BC8D1|nr:glycosyltransferase family 4 protein [Priestia megaterium]MCM3197162.1 glycosyltransferase family 4 protein [Priestia megaterium]
MKILLATYWIVPHVGGVWNYMEQLKRKLEDLGHKVDLLGYGEFRNWIHIVNENRRVETAKLLPLIKTKLNEQSQQDNYADPIIKYSETHRQIYEVGVTDLGLENYDLINTQDVFSTACINRVRPKETPLVATLHGCVAHEMKHYVTQVHKTPTSHLVCEYFDELEHIAAVSADYTVVANNWLKNILTNEFRVPAEQIKVCHYGYDIDYFLKRMQDKPIIRRPADKKVILYTGRLVHLKGVHHLISALSHLKVIRKDWVCWIAGEGEKQAELEAQSKRLGLEDNVVFLGKRNDIPQLLSQSDIFVLPSLIENQPLSVIEAQISGKSVVVSGVGGLPEMVSNGITGLISPVGGIEDLCNILNLLLENEEYREYFGTNAQKWGMLHWSLDKGVERVLEVYNSAIAKKNNSWR